MADKASLIPNTKRTTDRRVEFVSDNMVTIYQVFRTMVTVAR